MSKLQETGAETDTKPNDNLLIDLEVLEDEDEDEDADDYALGDIDDDSCT